MAVSQAIAKTSLNISKISNSVFNTNKSLDAAGKSALKINKTLSKRNENTKKNIATDKLLFARRRENIRRKEQESIIESSGIGGFVRRQGNIIAESTKGFLGRMMDFVGTLLVGWLLNNLPTIIGLAQELIARIQRLVGIMKDFASTTLTIFKTFGSQLGAIYNDIVKFQFTFPETRRQFQTSMSDLEGAFSDLTGSFDDLTKLFTTPLTQKTEEGGQEGSYSGESVPEAGSTWGPGTPGSGGQLQPIHKQALDIISGPESGGNYNAMNNGKAGDRPGGSKKWLGKNLTDMTIGEIMDYQNNKKTLWAAGRYQFVPNTLPGVMKSAGLTPQDKFDKNNQDLMAITLVKQRGIQPWTVGGSKYSAKELQIVEQARNTPLGAKTSSSTSSNQPSVSPPTKIVKPKITGRMGDVRSSGRKHGGTDLAVPMGTPLKAISDGKIVDGGVDPQGWGNFIVFVDNRGIYHLYGHIQNGYRGIGPIKKGEIIAKVGMSGRTTGPHLHWETGTKWNGYVLSGKFDPLSRYDMNAPFNTQSDSASITPTKGSPTAAQITAQQPRTTAVAGQVTQERRGPTVVVAPQAPAPTPPPMGGGYEGSSMGGMIILDPLNRYTTQKLLLELAYT